jgi:DNA repair protein RadC
MPDYNTHINEMPPQFSVMDKVGKYGYDHLVEQEHVQLTFELIGYKKQNPGFKSVRELFDAGQKTLSEYFSKTQIIKLKTIREVSAEYLKEDLIEKRTEFTSPESVSDYLKLKISTESKERFICIFVDSKNRLIDCEIMSTGTVDQVVIYPRDIMEKALMCNSTGLIVAHNHPSGSTDPSGSDIRLTEQLKKAGEALNISVLDHMIIGGNDYFSFREEGLMEKKAEYSISAQTATKKEFFSGKTLATPPSSEEPERNVSKVFEDAINRLKENEKCILNKRIEQLLGGRHLHLDDLPNTMYLLNKTFDVFQSEYSSSGYINFEKIENHVGLKGSSTYHIDKEIYNFFEKTFLSDSELEKFGKMIPDANIRQELFASYTKNKQMDLSHYTRQETGFIERMFKIIINGFSKLMGRKHELEMLFEDFKNGPYQGTQLHQDKIVINSSELSKYDSLNGIDMIIGDADFGQTNLRDLGDVSKITGKAVFCNSKIHSLGALQSVGELDLRDSYIDDLGELKTVHGNVYSNSISFDNWKEVEIEKDIFSFGANMTAQYENLRNSPAQELEIAKDIDFEMDR